MMLMNKQITKIYIDVILPYPKKFGDLTLKFMLSFAKPNNSPLLMKSRFIRRQYVNPVPILSSVKIFTSYYRQILTTKPLNDKLIFLFILKVFLNIRALLQKISLDELCGMFDPSFTLVLRTMIRLQNLAKNSAQNNIK